MAVQQCTLGKAQRTETLMHLADFDWDQGNGAKCQDHSVSQAAIESMFRSLDRSERRAVRRMIPPESNLDLRK